MAIVLASYNVQRGLHLEGLVSLFREVEVLRRAAVVAVQEATWLPDGRNLLEVLAAALSPEHRWSYRTVMTYPGKEYGNGFLWAGGCRAGEPLAVRLPQVAELGWLARRKTEGGRPDTKAALVQDFAVDGRPLRVANVHLDFAGGWRHRRRQLEHLLAALAEQPSTPGPEVVCGDFNTVGHHRWPGARRGVRRALAPLLEQGYADVTSAVPYTSDLFRSIDPADPAAVALARGRRLGLRFRQKTDHVLVRGADAHADGGVPPLPEERLFGLSDHLPLLARFAPGPEAAAGAK